MSDNRKGEFWVGAVELLVILPGLFGLGWLFALPLIPLGIVITLPAVVVSWIGYLIAGDTGAIIALLCLMALLQTMEELSVSAAWEKLADKNRRMRPSGGSYDGGRDWLTGRLPDRRPAEQKSRVRSIGQDQAGKKQ